MVEDRVISDLYGHANACYPNECCGFIRNTSAGPEAIPVANVHSMPRSHFKISPADYIAYSGGAICMYHSHPNRDPKPSEADRGVMKATELPQLVFNWPHGQLSTCGHARAPLIGRPFIYGLLDCYGLVRSYYAETLGLELTDYVRPRWGWWEGGPDDPFTSWYQHAGFKSVKDGVLPHDVILLRLAGASHPNHAGVITEEGKLLHHRFNGFSCKVTYDGYYRDNTMMVLRYGS